MFLFDYCFFFFSSRRRHTSCALVTGVQTCALPIFPWRRVRSVHKPRLWSAEKQADDTRGLRPASRRCAPPLGTMKAIRPRAAAARDSATSAARRDRQSVVSGKSVSVRVDLGGRRIIKKKQHKQINQPIKCKN